MLVEKGIIGAELASSVCESLEEQGGKSMAAGELLRPNAKVNGALAVVREVSRARAA